MRTRAEILAKIDYLQEQINDLERSDEEWLIDSCDNDIILLRWVLGEVEL